MSRDTPRLSLPQKHHFERVELMKLVDKSSLAGDIPRSFNVPFGLFDISTPAFESCPRPQDSDLVYWLELMIKLRENKLKSVFWLF